MKTSRTTAPQRKATPRKGGSTRKTAQPPKPKTTTRKPRSRARTPSGELKIRRVAASQKMQDGDVQMPLDIEHLAARLLQGVHSDAGRTAHDAELEQVREEAETAWGKVWSDGSARPVEPCTQAAPAAAESTVTLLVAGARRWGTETVAAWNALPESSRTVALAFLGTGVVLGLLGGLLV